MLFYNFQDIFHKGSRFNFKGIYDRVRRMSSIRFDVILSGGSVSAVAAALELKSRGHSVLVISHRTYLGEDLCDSLRLALPAELNLSDPLAKQLFGRASEAATALRPMHVKRELDRVLDEADIPVLLGTAPGEVLVDARGKVAGLTVCNRSGRRAIACRALVDGSLRGELLRLARVPLSPPAPKIEVVRRVIGGPGPAGGWELEGDVVFDRDGSPHAEPLWAHHSTAELDDGGWDAWMRLEQHTRMYAFRPGQELSADGVFAWTGERLRPDSAPEDAGPDAVSALDRRLWVTGPTANVDPTTRESLLRHDGCVDWGRRVAGWISEALPSLESGDPVRGLSLETLPPEIACLDLDRVGALSLPDSGFAAVEEVDVLVVGGGTGGAPAAIAAARSGANTLVAEFLSGLGGVGTLGLIGKYWFGNRVGFTAELDRGAAERSTKSMKDGAWDVEAKMQWYHEEITKAGGRVWYKTMVCGALREGDRVVGAILCTPQGRVAVRAKCVVDATGSAEVAAAAGAETVSIGQGRLAVQGTGLPGRDPGTHYRNTDYDFIDDSSAEDVGSAHVTAREKFKTAFDAGQHVDSRERRRVVGDIEVSPMDIRLCRMFPDSIVKARSNFDTHGFTVHPLFMIVPPDHEPQSGFIPLRALLPRGLEGVLVTGLGISAHRDAMPVIRMQADVQNQGYAAGVIAALADGGPIRNLDIAAIQRRLVEKGILDPDVPGSPDSFPLPASEIDRALWESVEDPNLLDRVFTLPEAERNAMLRQAFHESETYTAKRHFAFVLGILGDDTGREVLERQVAETPWDEGWNFTGMGQFGASMSPLDSLVIALGRCGGPETPPTLRAKAKQLPEEAEFSHYRALAEAFETIGDPGANPVLEALLKSPGIAGHAVTSAKARLATASDDSEETRFRNASLIELHLATALYRLDPDNSQATDILNTYCRDLRGLFAAHARNLLGSEADTKT